MKMGKKGKVRMEDRGPTVREGKVALLCPDLPGLRRRRDGEKHAEGRMVEEVG